jgi:hypothetical protein
MKIYTFLYSKKIIEFYYKDVILYNNADALSSLSLISTNMIITSNGNVTWLSAGIFRRYLSVYLICISIIKLVLFFAVFVQ